MAYGYPMGTSISRVIDAELDKPLTKAEGERFAVLFQDAMKRACATVDQILMREFPEVVVTQWEDEAALYEWRNDE